MSFTRTYQLNGPCPEGQHVVVHDGEVERLAHDIITQHEVQAARVAAERLNEMIDRNNLPGRDVWACVVRRIHERQGSGPVWAGQLQDWRNNAPRFGAAF
jgi:hypothetical protein